MFEKLASRKLFAFTLIALTNLINGYFGNVIDDGTMTEVNKLTIGYIVGQGAVDFAKELPALSTFGKQLGLKFATAQAAKEADAEPTSP